MATTHSETSTAAPKVNLGKSGRNLLLSLEGNWNIHDTRHGEIDALFAELDREGPADALQIDMSKVGSWDTSLLIVVARAEDWCQKHNVKFLRESLPKSVASLIAISEEVPERKTGRESKKSSSLFATLGNKTINVFEGVGTALEFTGDAVLSFGRILRGKAAFDWRMFWLTMQECSAQALPIVGLISFLTGLIFAFVGAIQLRQFGPDVGGDVWLGADQAAEVHEFVNAKLVGLGGVDSGGHAALPEIVSAGPPGGLADPVAPVIPVGKATAGPAEIRRADPLHVVHKLFADSVHVWYRRVLAHPHAIVDDAAEVLDEVPIDLRADDGSGLAG